MPMAMLAREEAQRPKGQKLKQVTVDMDGLPAEVHGRQERTTRGVRPCGAARPSTPCPGIGQPLAEAVEQAGRAERSSRHVSIR
jgi:hypothetical protein